MSGDQSYTISEAAALTGLHRNTIRQRIRLGQLEAIVRQGKFGEEYRIAHATLIRAGLMSDGEGRGTAASLPPQEPPPITGAERKHEPSPLEPQQDGSPPEALTVAALCELYRRHEQAMFRLGYLESELERIKALAESAESLRNDAAVRQQEVVGLQAALKDNLAEREQQAQEVAAIRRELEESRRHLEEKEDRMGLLRQERDALQARIAGQEAKIEELEARRRRPFWHSWRR